MKWPIRLTAVIAALTVGTAMLPAQPAEAYQISVPATILGSTCTNAKGTWRGRVQAYQGLWPGYQPVQPTGTFKFCVVKLRLKDSDKKGDYYALDTTTTFKTSASFKNAVKSGAANFFGTEPFNVQAKSYELAINNVYDATPNIVEGAWADGVTAGFSIGPISISSASQLDRFTTVKRVSLSRTYAQWDGSHASDVSKLETVYSMKVKERKKGQKAPVMTGTLVAPWITYTWKKFTAYAHGYPYTAYRPDQTTTYVKTIEKKL